MNKFNPIPILSGGEIYTPNQSKSNNSISTLMGFELDDVAPYQRDYCWENFKKEKLIQSILNGIPIGTMHLVEKEDGESYYILDGKQRWNAINEFYRNQYPIEVTLRDGKKDKLTYKQISDHAEPTIKRLAGVFKNYAIANSFWPAMPLKTHSEIFEQINYSEDLNRNERIYCKRFYCQLLLTHVLNTCKLGLQNHLKTEILTNKRFAGTKLMHLIMLKCCWGSINESAGEKSTRATKVIEDSAEYINKKIINTSLPLEDMDLIINKIGLDQQCLLLGKSAKCLKKILSINNLDKKINAPLFFDFMCFFYRHLDSNRITTSFVDEHINYFKDMMVSYMISELLRNKGRIMSLVHLYKINERQDELDKLFAQLNVDVKQKNKGIPAIDVTIAKMKAGDKCPVCKIRLLTNENVQIDHVNPKSKTSETKYIAICDHCNGEKSNLTVANLDKQKEYITSHA